MLYRGLTAIYHSITNSFQQMMWLYSLGLLWCMYSQKPLSVTRMEFLSSKSTVLEKYSTAGISLIFISLKVTDEYHYSTWK